jgi:GT2 family glycosyltransferase
LISIPWELVVVDSGSSDRSREEIADGISKLGRGRLVGLQENVGFAEGMNRALAETKAPYVLSLNADNRPLPVFLEALVRRVRDEPGRVGAATGRLYRPSTTESSVLDAAGMKLRPTWRHFDRGSGATDRGQYDQPAAVFGGTGAGTLFSRAALEDVAVDGEVFLTEFHSYREDAELCFRLRERGWEIVYEPAAIAIHVRHNVPARRRQMTALINYHSLKNRFLLRAYHETLASFVLTAIPTLLRDLGILLYELTRERSSLSAFGWLWHHRKRIIERRRKIQSRRLVSRLRLAGWFLRSSRPL